MLDELIEALIAAAFVTVLPGWFWTKLLLVRSSSSSLDPYEHLAYCVGLSITLVAAAALVPTRMFGMAVTLSVTLGCVGVVFLMGVGAYLFFGEAENKGMEEEARPEEEVVLGTPALVLLIGAFGLALGVVSGVLPGVPIVPMVALLVLLAGISHLLASLRRTTPQAGEGFVEPWVSTVAPAVRYAALSAVLVLALLRGYLGPMSHHWPYPRGVDRYEHAVMTNMTLSKGTTESFMLYPPGFHTITAMICRISGLEPLEVFPVLAPLLLLVVALALYVLARRVWGWHYGVLAALFSVLLEGTYLHFAEARYPNLVAAQFLMVLAVGALVGLYASPSIRSALLFALLGSSVVLYHQVSSLYMAALLAVVGLVLLPYLLVRDRRRGLVLFGSLALLGLLSLLYAWDTYDLPQAIAGLLGGSGSSTTDTAVNMAIGTQAPYPLEFLAGNMVSQPVAWLGLLGVLLVAGELLLRRRLGVPQRMACLTLLFWVLLLFVGSRTSLTGFPQRFGRDLGIPLAVFAAFGFAAILRSLLGARKQVASVFVASLTVLLATTLVGVRLVSSLESASGPSVQMTITPQIAAAGDWLREHNEGGNIMVSPHINQVPSRMMLAMGWYSALQSFDAWQIEHPRDLPPTGPGPLKDVLWVMKHPAGERTDQILKKRDVRYIVLYKNMPDRPTIDYWKNFKARPDLYRTVFGNKDVLIVVRRGRTSAD